MMMLEESIENIWRKAELSDNEADKELLKSVYYHLCDYKDVLNKSIELTNEITEISHRWELVKKANKE